MNKALIGLLVCLWTSIVFSAPPLESFEALLQLSELEFRKPEGFKDLPPGANEVMDYERAVRSEDGTLEIRIAIRPLKNMTIDYDDPHGAVPDPNHIFPLVFESLVSRLSDATYAPSREYSPADAQQHFNADWAAAAVFDANPAFLSDFPQGLVLALHRNKVSDAYVVFLFGDYKQVKPLLDRSMNTVVFSQMGKQ